MATDPRVPLVRVNAGTLTLAGNAITHLNVVVASQTRTVVDSIPPRLLHRSNGNPVGAGSLQGQIEDVYLTMTTTNAAPGSEFRFSFWGNDKFATSVDADRLLLSEESFGTSEFTDLGGVLVGHIGGLSNPYRDYDSTGEFHVAVESTTSVDYPMKIEFTYRPMFPSR